jgi:hypothetical protein
MSPISRPRFLYNRLWRFPVKPPALLGVLARHGEGLASGSAPHATVADFHPPRRIRVLRIAMIGVRIRLAARGGWIAVAGGREWSRRRRFYCSSRSRRRRRDMPSFGPWSRREQLADGDVVITPPGPGRGTHQHEHASVSAAGDRARIQVAESWHAERHGCRCGRARSRYSGRHVCAVRAVLSRYFATDVRARSRLEGHGHSASRRGEPTVRILNPRDLNNERRPRDHPHRRTP